MTQSRECIGGSLLSAPAVSGSTVYATAAGLQSFSSDGATGCSGIPVVCQPLRNDTGNVLSLSPVVVSDIVVIAPLDLSTVQPLLEAFDTSALTGEGTHALARPTVFTFPAWSPSATARFS